VLKVQLNGAAAGNVQLPMFVAPSRKLTAPVGVPAPGAVTVTVAVKVTDCPNTDGFAEDVRLVLVFALLTTCETAVLVLVLKLALPT